MISKILGYKSSKVISIGSLWLNNYKLICNDEEIAQTFKFCREKLKLNPIILLAIFRKRDEDCNKNQFHFTTSYKKFVSLLFDEILWYLRKNVEADQKAINPFFRLKDNMKEYVIEEKINERSKNFEDGGLYDCPFKYTENRSKEDIYDYIVLLDILININKLTPNTIKDILNCSETNAKFLNKIFKCVKDKDLDSMLDMVDAISNKINFPMKDHSNSNQIKVRKNKERDNK